ncbi:hypothetical protein D6833_10865 [Candidatus Parcubacteria bacterium]|nr:MAG: hypothetical protein D6833_10865 [Candidatus Parcubacteria bacterium]
MTYFTERYKNHPIHNEINALRESITTAHLDLPKGEVQDSYERFLRVFEFIIRCLDQLDPELTSDRALNELQQQIQQLKQHFEAFKQNQDHNALNSQADATLDRLYLLPRLMDGVREFSESLKSFRIRANEVIDALVERRKKQDAHLDSLDARLAEVKSSLDEYDKLFESQKARIDELVTNQQTAFSQEQQRRNDQFAENQNQRQLSFDELKEKARQEFELLIEEKGEAADAQRKEFADRAEKSIAALEADLERARQIVGLIGNTGMTGHYRKVANAERKRAEIYRILTLVFFSLMVYGVWRVVKEVKSEDFSWQVALFRVGVALTLLAPAIYCARESTRHRSTERRNRRIELELASINPYLESLPDEKAQAVKEQLAHRYFGNEASDPDVTESIRPEAPRLDDLMNILERLAKLLRR